MMIDVQTNVDDGLAVCLWPTFQMMRCHRRQTAADRQRSTESRPEEKISTRRRSDKRELSADLEAPVVDTGRELG